MFLTRFFPSTQESRVTSSDDVENKAQLSAFVKKEAGPKRAPGRPQGSAYSGKPFGGGRPKGSIAMGKNSIKPKVRGGRMGELSPLTYFSCRQQRTE